MGRVVQDARLITEIDRYVLAAQEGDPSARRRVRELVEPFVVRWCRARVGTRIDHSSAEDVARDVWLAVADMIENYRPATRPFLAWVAEITSSKAADAYRGTGRELLTRDVDVPDATEEPGFAVLGADSARELLDHLPEQQQTVLILRIAEGLSVDDTARLLALSAGSVRSVQHRALQQLRLLLTRSGRVLAAHRAPEQ